jgi:hypothetical protein
MPGRATLPELLLSPPPEGVAGQSPHGIRGGEPFSSSLSRHGGAGLARLGGGAVNGRRRLAGGTGGGADGVWGAAVRGRGRWGLWWRLATGLDLGPEGPSGPRL